MLTPNIQDTRYRMECSNYHLKVLGRLSQNLRTLVCSHNQLLFLNYLPPTLIYLNCSFNNLAYLILPINLEVLICSNNVIMELSNLPTSLLKIYSSSNRLTDLNEIGKLKNLIVLDLSHNLISSVEDLPANLKILDISRNEVFNVDSLPEGLEELNCRSNNIHNIEKCLLQTTSLRKLNLSYNNIASLGKLPRTLQYLEIFGNPIYEIANLPISWWLLRLPCQPTDGLDHSSTFDIRLYRILQKLQRRWRIKVEIRNQKAKVIQNACYNWLFNVKCKDGTVGIVPRLAYQQLVEDGLVLAK